MSGRDYICETFKDGDTLVEYEHTEVVASGMVVVTVSMPVLQTIEKVLTCLVTLTDPATTTGAISNVKVSGTTVGMTLENIGAGTTITINVAAVGF